MITMMMRRGGALLMGLVVVNLHFCPSSSFTILLRCAASPFHYDRTTLVANRRVRVTRRGEETNDCHYDYRIDNGSVALSNSMNVEHGDSAVLSLPPIPDPSEDPGDDFSLTFRRIVPQFLQLWMRDSGLIRGLWTVLFWCATPTLANKYPWAVVDFLRLIGCRTNGILMKLAKFWRRLGQKGGKCAPEGCGLREDLEIRTQKIPYGPNARQYIHLINVVDPPDVVSHPVSSSLQKNHTIIFVHGGGWGSGSPEHYVLAAIPFLNSGRYSQVAFVGYRTYPSADVQGQIDDVAAAIQVVPRTTRMTVLGHSSGSHISSMAFLQGQIPNKHNNNTNNNNDNRSNAIDAFIGLSGVYDIPSHFKWERARGVERISIMAPACGLNLRRWKELSPTRVARQHYGSEPPCAATATAGSSHFPSSTLLIHGCADTTVPYTSTKEFAEASGLDWIPLLSVGHSETVTDLMFGEPTRDIVLDWLK